MQDAEAMLSALEALHAVTMRVELRPLAEKNSSRWSLTLLAVSDSATPMEPSKTYRWFRVYGSHDLGDMGSVIYNACYELEKLLQAGQWVQQELPQ